jgi:hypothetical protein
LLYFFELKLIIPGLFMMGSAGEEPVDRRAIQNQKRKNKEG